MPQDVLEADFENVIFCYQVGMTFTAIWTKPKEQWLAEVPNHLKMSFGFSTPSSFYGDGLILRADQIADVIRGKIREKAELQKESGCHFAMKTTQRKGKVKSR